MSSEQVSADQQVRTFTEDEVKALVESAQRELRETISDLRNELRNSEFRCRVAEWAVAGLMSRNLRLNVAVNPLDSAAQKKQDAIDMATHLGRNAGEQFLRSAELHFKSHADYADLKSKMPPHMNVIHYSTSDLPGAHPIFWPRPFK